MFIIILDVSPPHFVHRIDFDIVVKLLMAHTAHFRVCVYVRARSCLYILWYISVVYVCARVCLCVSVCECM